MDFETAAKERSRIEGDCTEGNPPPSAHMVLMNRAQRLRHEARQLEELAQSLPGRLSPGANTALCELVHWANVA